MIAELAAASAAIGAIKSIVSSGADIARAGKAISKFVNAEEDLQRKVTGKSKSSASGSDLENFMALESIRNQKQELKELMIFTGRPGLYQDFVSFQTAERKRRRAAEQEAFKKRRKRIQNILIAGALTALLGAACLLIFIVYMGITTK